MFEFPNRLIYREGDLEDRVLSFEDLYARILVRLEHLQSLFFVERLMLRHGHPDDGRLLTISFEMVTLTQVFWTHQDRFMSIRRDLEWLVRTYPRSPTPTDSSANGICRPRRWHSLS